MTKASLRPSTEKLVVSEGMVERKVCGLGITGSKGIIAELVILRSEPVDQFH